MAGPGGAPHRLHSHKKTDGVHTGGGGATGSGGGGGGGGEGEAGMLPAQRTDPCHSCRQIALVYCITADGKEGLIYCPVMRWLRAIPTDCCRAVPRVVAGVEGIAGWGSAGEGESMGTAKATWGSAEDARGSGAGLAGGGGGGGGGGEGYAAPCMCSPCLSLRVHAEASRDMTALLDALYFL